MRPDTQFRLQVLGQMLNLPQDDILAGSLECYIQALQENEKEAFKQFLAIAESRKPNAVPADGDPKPLNGRFKLTSLVQSIRFNDDSVRRRIFEALAPRKTFTRDEFNEIVAVAMRWDPSTGHFGVETTFPNPRRAAQQWWSTLKNRDHLIEAA
jgi:hypothetical protein